MARLVEIEHLPIRVTGEGQWLHGDRPLHPRVALLFARHVVPLADGQYCLRIGHAKEPLEVADTAFFVTGMQEAVEVREQHESILTHVTLQISDQTEELLDFKTLMQSSSHVLYCRIQRHGYAVPCRFSTAHYYRLAEYAQVTNTGAYLLAKGSCWPIMPYNGSTLDVSMADSKSC